MNRSNVSFLFVGLIVGALLVVLAFGVTFNNDSAPTQSVSPTATPQVTPEVIQATPEATTEATESGFVTYARESGCPLSMRVHSMWLRSNPDPAFIHNLRYMNASEKFYVTSAQIWFDSVWLYGVTTIEGQSEIGWTKYREGDFILDQPCPMLATKLSELAFVTPEPTRDPWATPYPASTCLATINRRWPVPVVSGPSVIGVSVVEEIPGGVRVTVTQAVEDPYNTWYRISTGWLQDDYVTLHQCSVATIQATPWPTATPYR